MRIYIITRWSIEDIMRYELNLFFKYSKCRLFFKWPDYKMTDWNKNEFRECLMPFACANQWLGYLTNRMIIPLPRLTKNMHFELNRIYVDGKIGNVNVGSLFLYSPPSKTKNRCCSTNSGFHIQEVWYILMLFF